ncbi:TonB-dependent receptor domain-containing protein [Runella salmonicolor]|uniref:TonB-dependent receptor n=1 Tax=Runella salmonicolor TaxID=2950278 RepID=A0ABT1FQE9_9BACT|nr:TonB-dependent receptor [Runella salmonicolor]MCP1383993.1 TonB-dependent receptor [Runella salmonicolor]
MKQLFLLALCMGLMGTSFAQKSKITGFVLDSTARKPVEFATVALMKDTKVVEGTTSDVTGKFTFSKVPAGVYQLKITFVGYKDKTLLNVAVTTDNDLDLGVVPFALTAQQLNEVKVVEQKALFEDRPDRLVYNAEKDITIKGGNAGDVLRKIPSIAVDLDGNVELRGSSNIKVLINNKPSNLMAKSIADVLKLIPADDIKQIEVITSPSAKYDAEGTAGIINIITKRNNLQGINGKANTSIGRWNDNYNGSLNYRKKSFGLSARGGFNKWRNKGENNLTRLSTVENYQTKLIQNTYFRGGGENLNGNISAEWDIDTLNRLSAGLNFYDGKNGMNFDYINNFTSGSEKTLFTRKLYRIYDWDGGTLNVDYNKTFKKPKKEFNVLTMFSKEAEDSYYNLDQLNAENVVYYREKSPNASRNYEGTVQVDFTNPLDSVSTLELGAKTILRNVKSDYRVAAAFDGSTNFVDVPALANVFDYNQQVASSYISYSRTSKNKWGINAGARYEHTFIQAEFLAGKVPFSNNYGNIIPNISLSRNLPKNQKLKLSYSQRIQRPMLWFLNPYVNASEPKSTYSGNPYLKPELTHSAEASYNVYIKESSINTTFFMRQTNNAIERIRTVNNEGVSHLSFQNISQNISYGLTLSATTKIKKKFSSNGSINLYYNILNSPALQAQNANWMYRINMNSTYDFGKGFKGQFFGFFNSPRVMLQGKMSGYAYYNIALQKEVLKKKGSISAGLDNFFAPFIEQKMSFSSPTFVQEGSSKYFNRGWRVSFSYEFGKMTNAPQRQKKSINNDDKKGGEN